VTRTHAIPSRPQSVTLNVQPVAVPLRQKLFRDVRAPDRLHPHRSSRFAIALLLGQLRATEVFSDYVGLVLVELGHRPY
jgi:hypothetical protein